ncbi:hypothetical protein ACFQX6_56615 [Streptosporangium lutulentum]
MTETTPAPRALRPARETSTRRTSGFGGPGVGGGSGEPEGDGVRVSDGGRGDGEAVEEEGDPDGEAEEDGGTGWETDGSAEGGSEGPGGDPGGDAEETAEAEPVGAAARKGILARHPGRRGLRGFGGGDIDPLGLR